jgi:uncharacterized membrane protein YccC
MATNPEPNPRSALWHSLIRLDRSKINSPWMALRNAIAVALPLAIGIATGNPLGAVAISSGALNVASSDGPDPYAQRARRMLAWSVLGAVAVFTGSVTGKYNWAAIMVASVWAFLAGMLVSISTRAGDLGLNTLVTMIVYSARGALPPKGALYAALLVLGGGLLQTCLALLFWPVRRFQPGRRAIGSVYLSLSKEIAPDSIDTFTSASPPNAQIQDTLTALGRDHSLEAERFLLLFDQVDRIRMSVFTVGRLRTQLDPEQREHPNLDRAAACLDSLIELTSKLLAAVSQCLLTNTCIEGEPQLLQNLEELLRTAQAEKQRAPSSLADEIATATDLLGGQLRLVVQLAANTTSEGMRGFAKHEAAPPWELRYSDWLATLGANLDFHSSICRHAIRLTACVAIGDAIGRAVSWDRSYWLPMTIAVILKPDFTTTFSRGLLRLLGTFAGLIVATALYHYLFPESASAIAQLILVGIFTFILRYIGPANYGVLSVAISGLIVFLIAETGIQPMEVVYLRALNTAVGGVLALIAYALWPTWERTQASEAMAEMLDACRLYFQAVVQRFKRDDAELEAELDDKRNAWRRARSNAEASVDRVSSEPGVKAARLDCLTSMLASSQALAHAIMGLEAGLIELPPHTSVEALENFANDVDFTLYFLVRALRGSSGASRTLPKLREDHRKLLDARNSFSHADEFILTETDRLTVSLNTLLEQVTRYVGGGPCG